MSLIGPSARFLAPAKKRLVIGVLQTRFSHLEFFAFWPVSTISGPGRAGLLCPGTSDLDFLGDLNRVVDLDAKISNRAFDFRVAQQ